MPIAIALETLNVTVSIAQPFDHAQELTVRHKDNRAGMEREARKVTGPPAACHLSSLM